MYSLAAVCVCVCVEVCMVWISGSECNVVYGVVYSPCDGGSPRGMLSMESMDWGDQHSFKKLSLRRFPKPERRESGEDKFWRKFQVGWLGHGG